MKSMPSFQVNISCINYFCFSISEFQPAFKDSYGEDLVMPESSDEWGRAFMSFDWAKAFDRCFLPEDLPNMACVMHSKVYPWQNETVSFQFSHAYWQYN